MSDLKSNSTGDLEIINGDLVIISDSDAAQQFLKQRLKTFYAEWFLDTGLGIPFYQELLVKNPNLEIIDSILKTEILNTPGIISLDSFSLDYDATTRSLIVNFVAQLYDGVIIFNERIP